MLTGVFCLDEAGNPIATHDQGDGWACEYWWPTRKEVVRHQCSIRQGYVTGDHAGYIFSNLGDVSHCLYHAGSCLTPADIHVIWKPDPRAALDWLTEGTYTVEYLDGHVMIQEKTLSLVIKSKVGATDVYETFEGFRIKMSLGLSIRVDQFLGLRARPKRDVTSIKKDSTAKKMVALEKDILTKIQYLADKVSAPISSVELLCTQVDEITRSLRSYAHMHPTLFARIITGMHYLHAKVAGPYIMIWPCEQVSDVKFEGPGECTHNIPITYARTNKTGRQVGYLDPDTLVITNRALNASCTTATTNLLYINGRLFTYRIGSVPHELVTRSIPTIPLKTGNRSHWIVDHFRDFIYNETEFEHVDIATGIYDYVNSQFQEASNYRESEYAKTSTNMGLSALGFVGWSPLGKALSLFTTYCNVGGFVFLTYVLGTCCLRLYRILTTSSPYYRLQDKVSNWKRRPKASAPKVVELENIPLKERDS